jgi:TolB-like protein
MTETRKLAALLAADIAGYSRLAGADEDRTLARLRGLRSDLIDPAISVHHGRVVKRTGDGILIEFRSVVDAVRCAIEVQNGMVERNAGVPAERRIEFRVGIHLGDVVEESDGDLMGDGVNITARLEGIAKSNGICLSEDAYRQVRARLDLAVNDLGLIQLKNIAEPVRVYSLEVGVPAPVKPAPQADAAAPEPSARHALPDRPSIAVLAFQNMSGDHEQEYFADGMAEDIITALSQFQQLFVIARNSSFTYKGRAVDVKQVGRELGVRYVLEGSVRKAGNRVRITGQLVDASTGAHLWADRFDGTVEDIFDLQDQVTGAVVAAIAPKLEQAEIERARRKPTERLDAYDYFLRGMAGFHEQSKKGNTKALELFYRAIELDPDFAAAHGMAAWCYATGRVQGWIILDPQAIVEARRLAQRAVELGQDDAIALSAGGFALAVAIREPNRAVIFIDRALVLNPNLAMAWFASGWVRAYVGEPDLAIQHMARAMRLSPFDPRLYSMQTGTAYAHFFAGRYEEAVSWSEKAVRAQPNWLVGIRVMVASYALGGRLAEAQKAMTQMLEVDPSRCTSNLRDITGPYRSEDFSRLQEGLRKAGLPD